MTYEPVGRVATMVEAAVHQPLTPKDTYDDDGRKTVQARDGTPDNLFIRCDLDREVP